jgi:hypothetical protein
MKRRRRAIPAPHDHPLPRANPIMAGRAKNIEALLSAREHGESHRRRKPIDRFPSLFSCVQVFIAAQLASGHGAFHKRSRGATVVEKGAASEGLVAGLISHLLLAAGKGG